jgi:hypothetical protein
MTEWIKDRLPTAEDADPRGMVRWGKQEPETLMHWKGVRLREFWCHSRTWRRREDC